MSERLGEERRALGAAAEDGGLLLLAPAPRRDVLAGEVNDRIVAFDEDIDAIQRSHIGLAKLIARELAHIDALDQHADPCLRAAA